MEFEDFEQRDDSHGHAGSAESERRLADRFDALEAERVFHRALELEEEALTQPHLFTASQLESIADEIDMDVSFVRQALGEVRLAPGERSWLDRKILPEALSEVETIEGIDRDQLNRVIDDWMVRHEGLIAAEYLDDGTVWDTDRRLGARLRAMHRAGGNRISRVAGGDVTHRAHSIGEDEHVVAMESQGSGPLLLAKLGLAAAIAVILFGGVGSLGAGLIPFLESFAGVLVVGAGIAGAAVAGARRWARGIRRALKRSLTGLADRATKPADSSVGPPSEMVAAALRLVHKRLRERRKVVDEWKASQQKKKRS